MRRYLGFILVAATFVLAVATAVLLTSGASLDVLLGRVPLRIDATPEPSPAETPTPTAEPTATPSPTPTPLPTPVPTPIPPGTVGPMTLAATNCHGGVVLSWSVVVDPRFHHYTTLRSSSADIPLAYPPGRGIIDWGGTYTTDPFVTSAVDAGLQSGQFVHYRAMAYDVAESVIAASETVSLVAVPVLDLGALVARPDGAGTHLEWTPYPGSDACFTSYKVLFSTTDTSPTWGEGAQALTVLTDKAASVYVTTALDPETTYHLRVQAFRATALGEPFLVAETAALSYAVPATPAPEP